MRSSPLFKQPHHPVVISLCESDGSIADFIAKNKESWDHLIYRHAGVLLRNTGVHDGVTFAKAVEAFGSTSHHYIGGNSPRTHLGNDIYTSTEYPAGEEISLHNEMSYLPMWPSRLYFNCCVPSVCGGQTTLASSLDVLEQMPADILSVIKERKLVYRRTLQPTDYLGKGWKTTYRTHDRAEVEMLVKSQGSTFEWLPKDALRVSTVCDATVFHPITGQEVWFNQAEQWHPSALLPAMRNLIATAFGADHFPHDCRFSDGGIIDDEVMRRIRSVLNANQLLFDWQAGDILVIDNLLAMHGRQPFNGPRRIQTFLAA